MLRILDVGLEATTYRVRLSQSPNRIARMAAIDGLAKTPGSVATRELERLTQDTATAPTLYGDIGRELSVGALAKERLHPQKEPPRDA